MLTPSRALALHAESGRPLPRVEELQALYNMGCNPRHGEVIMVAGRSGTQKSGFALWYTAMMNLKTLYFSADMSAFTASSRLACTMTGDVTEVVEYSLAQGGNTRQTYLDALKPLNFTFSFGSPITWRQVDEEMEAYVELWDEYPECIVFDNLMDFEGGETDYAEMMSVMSQITELARYTGATCLVLHHASDKTWQATANPWKPPGRQEIKNGMAEKPELVLGVALDPTSFEYNIAVLKQRMGPSNPSGEQYATLRCYPEKTQFGKYVRPGVFRPGLGGSDARV